MTAVTRRSFNGRAQSCSKGSLEQQKHRCAFYASSVAQDCVFHKCSRRSSACLGLRSIAPKDQDLSNSSEISKSPELKGENTKASVAFKMLLPCFLSLLPLGLMFAVLNCNRSQTAVLTPRISSSYPRKAFTASKEYGICWAIRSNVMTVNHICS